MIYPGTDLKFRITTEIPDFQLSEDYDDQRARYNDSQPLCVVGYCHCHAPRLHDCDRGRHKVHYEQVWTVSVDGADCDDKTIKEGINEDAQGA